MGLHWVKRPDNFVRGKKTYAEKSLRYSETPKFQFFIEGGVCPSNFPKKYQKLSETFSLSIPGNRRVTNQKMTLFCTFHMLIGDATILLVHKER